MSYDGELDARAERTFKNRLLREEKLMDEKKQKLIEEIGAQALEYDKQYAG